MLFRSENKTDESINALLAAYEQSKDVISLQKEIKREYDSVLEKDEELKTMVMATMQDAISEWVASFEPQTSEDDNQSQTDKKDTDQTDQLERTAYAKTDVNLREKRSTESDVIKTIKEGAKVTIVGVSKDGWFQIKNGGDTGFVKKEYIESYYENLNTMCQLQTHGGQLIGISHSLNLKEAMCLYLELFMWGHI